MTWFPLQEPDAHSVLYGNLAFARAGRMPAAADKRLRRVSSTLGLRITLMMMLARRIRTGTLMVGLTYWLVGMSLPLARAEDEIAAEAAKGRALTARELDTIYQDRSWRWNNGAALFRRANRTFIAWVDRGANATYAD